MFVEACAVGQPGQRIATRHEGDALDGALALGDVLAEREQELRLAIGAVDRKTGNRADALAAGLREGRGFVDMHLSGGIERRPIIRMDDAGKLVREEVKARPADDVSTRNGEHLLGCPVDHPVAQLACALHGDRHRNVLNDRIEEGACPIELALALEALRLVLHEREQRLRLALRIAQNESLGDDVTVAHAQRVEGVSGDGHGLARAKRLGVVGREVLGLRLRIEVENLPADDLFAIAAHKSLGGAIVERIALVHGVLHQKDGRDILDDGVEEAARMVQGLLGLETVRHILGDQHQEGRLPLWITDHNPLGIELTQSHRPRQRGRAIRLKIAGRLQRLVVMLRNEIGVGLRQEVMDRLPDHLLARDAEELLGRLVDQEAATFTDLP